MDTFRSWPRDQGGNPEPKEKTTLGNLGSTGKKIWALEAQKEMDTFRSWPRDQGGSPEPKEKTTLGNLGRPGLEAQEKKKSRLWKPKRRWIHSGPGLETRVAVLSQVENQIFCLFVKS